ncbi:MAG: response regulator transcription factor [Nodosilinea sp. LVE1205-7]|jgi:DNA-binding NarL/FixJ family response regulator
MPLTVLLAEDDEATCLSISDYLALEGYEVITAYDGEVALQRIFERQPQLIITDIAMPHLDGYALVQRVRQYPLFRLLPVIFLTAHNQTQDRIKGYQVGGDVYLPKPFELEELGVIVRSLLERSQIMQATWIQQVALHTAQQLALEVESRQPLSPPSSSEVSASILGSALTAREQDVLMLLSNGLSNAQIGDRLFLSPRTVEKYVSSLLRKTDTTNRSELLRFALSHHLVG